MVGEAYNADPPSSSPHPSSNKRISMKTLVIVIIGCTVFLAIAAIVVACIVVFGNSAEPDKPKMAEMYAASTRCNQPKPMDVGDRCIVYENNWGFIGEQQKCMPVGPGCAKLPNRFRTKSACEGACGGGDPRMQLWYLPHNEVVMFTYDSRKISGIGAPCVFPFEYKKRFYSNCISLDSPYATEWCATTNNYTLNKKRGECYPQYQILIGGICKFPFWVNGRWYTGCVGLSFGRYRWCSVTRVFEGKRAHCGASDEHIPKTIECEAPLNETLCQNGGTCFTYNDTTEHFCLCPVNYQGLHCDEGFDEKGRMYTKEQAEVIMTPCVETGDRVGLNYCANGGTCVYLTAFVNVENPKRFCICTLTWKGKRCQRKAGSPDTLKEVIRIIEHPRSCTPLWLLRRNLVAYPHGPIIGGSSTYGCKYGCVSDSFCRGFNYNRFDGTCNYIREPIERFGLANGMVNFELVQRCHTECRTSMFYLRVGRKVVNHTASPYNVAIGEGRYVTTAMDCVRNCASTADCTMADFYRDVEDGPPSCRMYDVIASTVPNPLSSNYILVTRCWADVGIFDKAYNITRGLLCTKQTFCRNGGTCIFHPYSDSVSPTQSTIIIERESEYAKCICAKAYTGPRCGERIPEIEPEPYILRGPVDWYGQLHLTDA